MRSVSGASSPSVSPAVAPSGARPGRVLVFFMAHESGRDVPALLDRVPQALLADPDVHLLCIDDASRDDGAEQARSWAARRGGARLTVLRAPVGQGRGGQQKLGLRLAVDAGFGFVAVVRLDGSCPPEALPDVIRPWREGRAEVVLGTRLRLSLRDRLLNRAQRVLTGQPLRDFHAGLRGYDVALLRRVFFEVNGNGDSFDMDLLLQSLHVGARVVELPVYETSAVPAPAPAGATAVGDGDSLRAAAQYRMHRMGMMCSLKYQGAGPEVYQDKTHMRYSSHRRALELVRELRPRTLLDVGSGPGHIARACEELGVRVTGADRRAPQPGAMSAFVPCDLEQGLPIDAFQFDAVLMLDVIEHLARPEAFLIGLRNQSQALRPGQPATRLILSTPNVAFAAVRMNLLLGRWNYAERGILDITHKRLFTQGSLLRLLSDCGYEVERVLPIGVPFEAVLPGLTGQVLGRLCARLSRLWPALFAFQTMVICAPTPGVRQVLLHSQRYTLDRDGDGPFAELLEGPA